MIVVVYVFTELRYCYLLLAEFYISIYRQQRSI